MEGAGSGLNEGEPLGLRIGGIVCEIVGIRLLGLSDGDKKDGDLL